MVKLCFSCLKSQRIPNENGPFRIAVPGATRSKEGLLAAAASGTVFLDDIGELPLDLQAKLLYALQDKEIQPLGSNRRVPIKARIVAATPRDLAVLVEQRKFRKDLYFRLNIFNVELPALRKRRQDIAPLANHFLERMRSQTGVFYTLSEEVLRVLGSYDWPGNVRELENIIERACALSSGATLRLEDMPPQLGKCRVHNAHMPVPKLNADPSTEPCALTIAEMEKKAILHTMHQLNGDKLMAARSLGIGKTTLYRKLKEYAIADGLGF